MDRDVGVLTMRMSPAQGPAESEVEQEELNDARSLRNEYNSELVDDVESESDQEQDDDPSNSLFWMSSFSISII